MKNLVAIFLTCTVLIASVSHTSIWLAFKVNQSDIIERFCINKDAPQKHCNGQCFLQDRLSQNSAEKDGPSPFTQFELSLKINFICAQFPATETTGMNSLADQLFFIRQLSSQFFPQSAFQPPEGTDLPAC